MKLLLNDPNATLIDVRTPDEFTLGHAKGAINIPLDQIKSRLQEFKSMSQPIILYCRTGNRSAIAKTLLKLNGLPGAHNGGAIDEVAGYLL